MSMVGPMESTGTSPREIAESTTDTEASTSDSNFIIHQVNKFDTLAGLAIRYNVTVADIKRANGLLSDSAMFGRDTILIPKRHIPLAEECSVLFAQVAAGLGRDPVLNHEANLQPASAAVARVARTLNIVNGRSYPDDVPTDCRWLYQCGGNFYDDLADKYVHRRESGSSGGEVEMIERSADGNMFIPQQKAGPTRMHEAVRRRRLGDGQQDGLEFSDADEDYKPVTSVFANGSNGKVHKGQDLDMNAVKEFFSWKHLQQLSATIGDSVLVQKIKQVANQPALASSGLGSVGDAADAILRSNGNGGVTSRWADSRIGQQMMTRNPSTASLRLKQDGKSD